MNGFVLVIDKINMVGLEWFIFIIIDLCSFYIFFWFGMYFVEVVFEICILYFFRYSLFYNCIIMMIYVFCCISLIKMGMYIEIFIYNYGNIVSLMNYWL